MVCLIFLNDTAKHAINIYYLMIPTKPTKYIINLDKSYLHSYARLKSFPMSGLDPAKFNLD